MKIEATGTIPELAALSTPAHQACLRLRSVRGLGIKQVAEALSIDRPPEDWVSNAVKSTGLKAQGLLEIWEGKANSSWEAAHVVPPLMRLLHEIENLVGQPFLCVAAQLGDGLEPIMGGFCVQTNLPEGTSLVKGMKKVVSDDHFFRFKRISENKVSITHILGWSAFIENTANLDGQSQSIASLACQADPLLNLDGFRLRGDLHSHTNWSDGAAALQTMSRHLSNII